MSYKLSRRVLCAFGMFVVVGTHIRMAVQAERNAVFIRVLSAFRHLYDVMQLNFETAELVAKAAVPPATEKGSFFNVGGETHIRGD